MKLFNMSALALVFFFGLSSTPLDYEVPEEIVYEECACCNAFEYCDYRNPDDFDDFHNCMTNMGCGIQ